MLNIVDRSFCADSLATLVNQGLHPVFARVMAARDVRSAEGLSAELKSMLAPGLLKNNMQMAVLLADAIAANKRLLIVADFDADGATACAVGVKGLRLLGAQVEFLVPNRFEYGYGLTPEIVALAATMQPEVIITVDNGIASVEGVAAANALGIQVLITDHHLPGDVLPAAQSIVNPNQHGCDFPSKSLAGVGVMFYVLMALRAELRQRGAFDQQAEPNLTGLLDLVALGTVADVVKLDTNNRILVEQGLRRIRAGKGSAGIYALLKIAGRDAGRVTAQDFGFAIAPRLNAAGRLDDMSLGIACLLTNDDAEAMLLAQKLDELNQSRRQIESEMHEDAIALLENIQPASQFTICLYDETWHQGVIGILASKIKERFHRPVIAFAEAGDGLLKGSGRSIAGLHLRDALDLVSKKHPALILRFGGHAMAAGLTIARESLDEFEAAFEYAVSNMIGAAALSQVMEVDGGLQASDFNLALAEVFERQIWGQGFPEPLFVGDFKVLEQRVVGEKHLKLKLSIDRLVIDAIFFGYSKTLPSNIKAVYQLQVNSYRQIRSVQLMIKEVEFDA